eukprot:jgi/Chlat1/593/Chrsp103S00948
MACQQAALSLGRSSFLCGNRLRSSSSLSPAARPQTQRLPTAAALRTAQLKISGRHLEVTEAIKAYVEKKAENAVSKYEDLVKEVDVRLSVRTGGSGQHLQKAEMTVFTKAGIVRAEEEADILYASIDLATDKVTRKLRKMKEKRDAKYSSSARGSPTITEVVDTAPVDSLVAGRKPTLPEEVVRTKYYNMPKLTPDEALEKMQMVDHDFYVFRNAENGIINVLYQRTHGGYGLIVPMDEDVNHNNNH